MKRIFGFPISLDGSAALAQTPAAMPTTTQTNTRATRTSMQTRTTQVPATRTTTKSSTMTHPAGMSKTSTTRSTKMKADGTPDLRYKTNKTTVKTRM